jgi:hypothetical protein
MASKLFNTYIIGTGILNTLLFNYNIYNIDIIRNNKKTKLLIMERLQYSFIAMTIGWLKLPSYFNYINIKILNANPQDYGFIEFPKKEIKYDDIFKHL